MKSVERLLLQLKGGGSRSWKVIGTMRQEQENGIMPNENGKKGILQVDHVNK